MSIDDHLSEPLEDIQASAEPSASEQVSVVIDDLRALVRSEIRYHRSRLDYTRYVFRWTFRYGAVAAFAFGGAAIALVIGLVLTLSPLIGPLGATLLVTLGFSVIGAISGLQARKWMRKVYFPEMQRDDDDIA
jgi:Putative Actinobacterial Holin-X, holin superfamily III